MSRQLIKRVLFFLCMAVLVFVHPSKAQDPENNHFIYIQAKAKQPFYVIMNKKVYSSSSIGYLIIPKLKDGTYDLRIGFPQAQGPEQNFTCVVKGADAGYSLEEGENGKLGLLNLQTKQFIAASGQTTLEDQYAGGGPAKTGTTAVQDKSKEAAGSNAFSEMLASATGDPTLAIPKEVTKELPKETPVVEPVKEDITQVDHDLIPEETRDLIQAAPLETPGPKPEGVVAADLSKTYGVIKSSQQHSDKGTSMTFVMFNSQSTDTIDILVPSSPQTQQAHETTGVAPTQITKKESLALFANTEEDSFDVDSEMTAAARRSARKQRREQQQEAKKFVDMGTSAQAVDSDVQGAVDNPFYKKSEAAEKTDDEQQRRQQQDNEADDAIQESKPLPQVIECDPITEKNFQKMQKKMIARNNDNDMIEIVDKYIEGKCLTTSQVKTLGGLFLSDAGRYALFHDAYSHVSDKQNFPSLEAQLLDSYFKKRFQQILQ